MASLHPDDGARMVLERTSLEPEVHYRVSVYEPGERLTVGGAAMGASVTLSWDGTPPASWIEGFLGRLLKGLPKKHADGSWPRKITRWRAER